MAMSDDPAGTWMAENLDYEFDGVPTMYCPHCDRGVVNVRKMLRDGHAPCDFCDVEYSAGVLIE